MDYGKALRVIRLSKRLSQVGLGKKLGVDASYISRIEAHKRTPTIEILELVSEKLSVPLYLIILLASEKEDLKGVGEEVTQIVGKNLLDLLVLPSGSSK